MKELLLKYGFSEDSILFRLKISDSTEYVCALHANETWALSRYIDEDYSEEPYVTTWICKDAELMERILQKNGLKPVE